MMAEGESVSPKTHASFLGPRQFMLMKHALKRRACLDRYPASETTRGEANKLDPRRHPLCSYIPLLLSSARRLFKKKYIK